MQSGRYRKVPSLADWIVNGMAAIRSISLKNTWREYADALLEFCLPSKSSSAQSLSIIMDTYCNDRIKEVIQRQFGKSDRKTILSSETQLMPKPKDWNAFLYNGENMMELIRFLALYYKAEKFGHKLEMPLIFTGFLRSMILVQWR